MTMNDMLIDAQGIDLTLDGQLILQDISLKIAPAEIITLIGPNGSGKTTLVRIVLGLLKPDEGVLWRKKQLRVSYMPQKLQLDNTLPMTVERFLQLADDFDPNALAPILAEVGAQSLLNRPLHSVSGGELRRIWLARCLLRKPELLVLDEPVQGVDANGQEELYTLIKRIRDRYQCAVLMVSHDLHLVMAATDRVVCLNHHICCTGHPESVQKHPEFLKLFGTAKTNLAVYTHHHDHHHDIHGDVQGDTHSHQGCKHD